MTFFTEQDQTGDGQSLGIAIHGDWTIHNYAEIKQALNTFKARGQSYSLHLDDVKTLDTAGVLLLADAFGLDSLEKALLSDNLPTERKAMVEAIVSAIPHEDALKSPPKPFFLTAFFENLGIQVVDLWKEFLHWVGFLGLVIVAFFRVLINPARWRLTSLVANIDSSGFKAVPIVMLLCFMVGAVVAFLGATVLENFGAQVFTVHLVTFSFLREFAIILTSILIAGRTASAYTAQLGSMKVNEEIDALRASGIDPLEVLVVPRILALVIVMPILTFLGMMAGIFGGMIVAKFSMDISPLLFIDILKNNVDVRHFFVGLVKAPIFAVVIAVTGCIEGFKVSGSAESVGEHTTSSVVKCIFLVILLDALFAVYFMEAGW